MIGLRVPRAVITAKTAPYLTHGKPGHRPELMNLDDPEIISAYGAGYRGLARYYLLAGTVSRLHRLRWAAGNLPAQDAGRQAPLDGDQDGP